MTTDKKSFKEQPKIVEENLSDTEEDINSFVID
jgi:hypothetical protein